MSTPWNRNRLTERLGIEYPIVQGPLGGLSSQRLAAAVSNFGGLGSFGAHSLAPPAIAEVVEQIRGLTSKPFAMNLWVSMEDDGARASDQAAFSRSLAAILPHLEALRVARPEYSPYRPARFEIVTIGTATTPDEAAALEQAGVDAIAASGFESGGHRGSFLRAAEDSLMGTMSQSAPLSTRTDVGELLTSLVEEVSAIAGPVAGWSARRRAY